MRMRSVGQLVNGNSIRLLEFFENKYLCAGETEAFLGLAIEQAKNVHDPAEGVENQPDVGCRCMGTHIYRPIIGGYPGVWETPRINRVRL